MMKKKVAKGLKTENLRPIKFHLKPKMHNKGNPGHPVVSSINCDISNISNYVEPIINRERNANYY